MADKVLGKNPRTEFEDGRITLEEYPVGILIRILAAQLYAADGIGTWCLWKQDGENRYFSTCVYEDAYYSFLKPGNCLSFMESRQNRVKQPVVLSDSLGLTWLAEYVCRPEEEEELLIVVGPMFMSSSSLKNIERALADRIASEMGYAPYYLTKKFHRETGVKLSDYIKQARIEYAKILLLTTNKSVQEISDLLQFNNRNYFTKVFTDIAGMSPSAYRDRVV